MPLTRGFHTLFRTAPWAALPIAASILLVWSAWALGDTASQLPPRGLAAAVHASAQPTGNPTATLHDPAPDPVPLARAAGLDPQEPFAVEWRGHLLTGENGTHHLRVRADDGVAVWVGDRLLLEETAPGFHDISAQIDLAAGLHDLRIRYVQFGGDPFFRLSWALPSWREDFRPVHVLPPSPELESRQALAALHAPGKVAAAWSIGVLAVFGVTLYLAVFRLAGVRPLDVAPAWLQVAIAAAAVALGSAGIDVGLEPWRGWAPDEVAPKDFAVAAREGFSNGWHSLYPPLHFYLLNLVALPFHVLDSWSWLTIDDPATHPTMHVLGRALSLLMGVLTLAVTALIARITIGGRWAALAPALLLTLPLFVFYSKTTNVDMPYVFWVAVAVLMFVRSIQTRAVRDHVALGAAVALAAATKDQAYGFFPGAAVVLVWSAWKATPASAALPTRLALTIGDRALLAGGATCAVVYALAMGLPWNADGALAHFTLITSASQPFRMFPATGAGLRDLSVATLMLLPVALGPVLTVFALVGLVVALTDVRRHRLVLLLLTPVASYAVCFLAVAGYVYDRFLLGVALVAVVFAALGVEAVLSALPGRRGRAALVIAILLLAAAPAVALNWRIVSDSREQVEQWMAQHLTDDPFVAGTSLRTYMPNLYPFRHVVEDRPNSAALLDWDADAIVMNEQWRDRAAREMPQDTMRALQAAGYEERFAAREARRPAWWHVLLRPASLVDPEYSNLPKISPPLSVWTRANGRVD